MTRALTLVVSGTQGLSYYTVTPCRVLDTREAERGGPIVGGPAARTPLAPGPGSATRQDPLPHGGRARAVEAPTEAGEDLGATEACPSGRFLDAVPRSECSLHACSPPGVPQRAQSLPGGTDPAAERADAQPTGPGGSGGTSDGQRAAEIFGVKPRQTARLRARCLASLAEIHFMDIRHGGPPSTERVPATP